MIRTGTPSSLGGREQVGFWSRPLSYGHALVLVFVSLTQGILLHVVAGYRVPFQLNPFIWLMGISLPVVVVVGRVYRKKPWVAFLSGIPLAVVSTSASGFLALVGGIVPQSALSAHFGIESMWSCWPFLFVSHLVLLNLLASVGKRLWPLNYTNVVYLANHLGLAIAILGGAGSALFLERTIVTVPYGTKVSTAQSDTKEVQLPFAIELNEFSMSHFPPVAAVARLDKSHKDGMRLAPSSDFLQPGLTAKLDGVRYRVLEFLPRAAKVDGQYVPVKWKTAGPAAKIEATLPDKAPVTGWIAAGAPDTEGSHIAIDAETALVMPTPRPKEFRSAVTIHDGATTQKRVIKVNEPIQVKGYTLYQISYDDTMGEASQISVLEAVKDRGIGWVYLGMCLLLLGTFLHLWNGLSGDKS